MTLVRVRGKIHLLFLRVGYSRAIEIVINNNKEMFYERNIKN